jgi:hypothetical protein
MPALLAAPVVDQEFGSPQTSRNTRSAIHHFIHEQNLAHYRKVLSETTDPTKRQTVLKLLADEQARLAPVRASSNVSAGEAFGNNNE